MMIDTTFSSGYCSVRGSTMRFLSDSRLKETEEHSVVRIVSHIRVLSRFLGAEKKDFYEQVPIMVRELIYRLNDDDPSVLKAANGALAALSKHVPAEELVKHVEFIRNLLASMVSDARRRKGGVGDGEFLLPGFNMPKGTS